MRHSLHAQTVAWATAVVIVLAAASASAGLIVNGSFETYDTTGWVVAAGNVDVTGIWTAADGSFSVDMNGSTAGTLSQTVATTVGAWYTLTFMMSANPDGAPDTSAISVSWDGTEVGQAVFDRTVHPNTRADMMWQPFSFDVQAIGATSTLQFGSLVAGGGYGPALDAVTLDLSQNVPEPSSLVLVLIGGSALVARRSQRRTRG